MTIISDTNEIILVAVENEMKINNTVNEPSLKRLRKQRVIFSEYFLSNLLEYLNFKEIARVDSAICNKSDRNIWLECIAKDFGSVSTKVQPYVTSDQPIKWCSKRNVQFKYLSLQPNLGRITRRGDSLLSMCCIDMVEFMLSVGYNHNSIPCIRRLLNELGKHCSKLKKCSFKSPYITDGDILPLILRNHDL